MKKKYKRIIKGIFILFIAIISMTDVNAAKCPKTFGDKVKNNGDGTITASVDSGKFTVFVQRLVNQDSENKILLDANGNQTTVVEEIELTPGNPITIRYNKDVLQNISIMLVYSEYTDKCYKDNGGLISALKNGNINGKDGYISITTNAKSSYYVIEKSYTINQSVQEPLVYNSNYNGICAYLRSGTWPNESDKEIYNAMNNIDKDQFKKYYNKITVSECSSEYLPYKISLETTAKSISAALKTYVSSLKPDIKVPDAPAGIKQTFNLSTSKGLADFNKGIKEQCSAIFPDGYKKTDEYQYTNENIYYAQQPEKSTKKINGKTTTCIKYCTETLTVRYGPPVATKGGLCFEYRVEVKSTVECDSQVKGNPPEESDYAVCTPIAQCSQKRSTLQDQGGPNEDFDACIRECDGGKYSQSCINKCYNRVYANKQKIKLSYTAKTKNIANKDACVNILNANTSVAINKMDDTAIKDYAAKVVDCIKNGDGDTGYYYSKNNQIKWQRGEYYWTKYARYYFSNQEIAERTIKDDKDKGMIGTWYNPDNAFHLYLADDEGFKKSAGIRSGDNISGTTWCTDECEYVGCDPKTQKLNKSDVNGTYQKDLEDYNNFVDSCNAEASCSTETASFTIKVNNKTKDKKENWIEYTTAKLNKSGLSDPDGIVLNRDSECYGKNTTGYKYLTEWSFPGTWINVKTGEISYKPKSDKSWTKSERKFCTNLNSANVNEAWWKYGVTKDKSDLPEEFKKFTTEELEKKGLIDLNILATATNFGKFKWNLNVQCFYALKESGCDCSDPECDDPECDPKPDSKKKTTISYRVRSVDNSDLFPQTSENSGKKVDTSSAGRTPGFNWTYAARNLKNSNYIIAPDLLISKIQSDGDNVYSKEPDYSFVLDRKALSTIRAYSNENGNNYTRFGGTSRVVNGVLVYESSLFRTVSGVTTSHKLDNSYIDEIGLVGCNNEENKSCYNYSTLVSGIGG